MVLILLLVPISSSLLDARVFGKKKKGVKGRYLEVENSVNLADYRGALLILEATEITSDKDRPEDDEFVRRVSEELLKSKLEDVGLFGERVSALPLELPEGQPILKLAPRLTLQHGSNKKRYWVGFGAGKEKLHIRIDIADGRSGKKLGYFNGYGTGGTWFPEGGVPYMASDDLMENYAKLVEYLVDATQ